jgi:phospholipid/cholesterol/gamma-HCH transport system substrate-binding protein
VWLAASAFNGVPGRRYGSLDAIVPQTGNLVVHDQVRIAGVRVGQVQRTAITPDGRARVTLQLEPGTKVPTGTTVSVRANGLLGARYVQLVPGTGTMTLARGATLRAGDNALTYGVPEALDTLDAPTRQALGTTLLGLGQGVLGRSRGLNDAIRLSAGATRPVQALTRSVLSNSPALQRLLPSLEGAAGTLNRSRKDIANLFGASADGIAPLIAERSAVQRSLDAAPPALRQMDVGLARGRRLLVAVRSLAGAAQRTLPTAPAGLRTINAVLRGSGTSLRLTAHLLDGLGPAIPATLRVTDALSPVLGPLANGSIDATPIVAALGRHGCDVENVAVNFRSMTGFGGNAHGPNGDAGEFRVQAVVSGDVTGLPDPLIHRVSYPAPCAFPPSRYDTTNPLTNTP